MADVICYSASFTMFAYFTWLVTDASLSFYAVSYGAFILHLARVKRVEENPNFLLPCAPSLCSAARLDT